MIELSATLLIAAASAFVGLVADEHPGALPDDGTALLCRWGYWSHFDHQTERSSWPLCEARTADELGAVAAGRYVLRDTPAVGDIFLQCSPVTKRFVRAGVVAEVRGSGRYSRRVPYYDAMTIEASTDEGGRLGGRCTLRVARRFLPSRGDRFIRWVELDDDVNADGRVVAGRILAGMISGAGHPDGAAEGPVFSDGRRAAA